jgi:hypothetical protein
MEWRPGIAQSSKLATPSAAAPVPHLSTNRDAVGPLSLKDADGVASG